MVKYPPGNTHTHSAGHVHAGHVHAGHVQAGHVQEWQQRTRMPPSKPLAGVSRRKHVPYDKMSASDTDKQQRRISFMSVYQVNDCGRVVPPC